MRMVLMGREIYSRKSIDGQGLKGHQLLPICCEDSAFESLETYSISRSESSYDLTYGDCLRCVYTCDSDSSGQVSSRAQQLKRDVLNPARSFVGSSRTC